MKRPNHSLDPTATPHMLLDERLTGLGVAVGQRVRWPFSEHASMFGLFRRNKKQEPEIDLEAPLSPEADKYLAAATTEFNAKQDE
jgi:hypothetical protein